MFWSLESINSYYRVVTHSNTLTMCVLSFDSVRPSLRREFIYGLYTKITTFPLLILVDEAQHKNDPNIWGCFQYSSKIYQIIIFGSLLPNCCIPSFHANLLLYFLRRDSFFTKYLTLWHHHSTRFISYPTCLWYL